jgi:hypothetical protein
MFKTISLIVVVLVAAVLLFAATRPDSFRVERSVTIQAPPEKVIALINDLHRWETWSPYEKKDPAMKRVHSGAQSGVGAAYAWEGNSKVGQGRMEITEATPSKVVMRLEFLKPFQAINTAEFTVQGQGAMSTVTWAIYGPSPYVSKLMGLVVNMDTMIGTDFEVGLANLKAIAEKP